MSKMSVELWVGSVSCSASSFICWTLGSCLDLYIAACSIVAACFIRSSIGYFRLEDLSLLLHGSFFVTFLLSVLCTMAPR